MCGDVKHYTGGSKPLVCNLDAGHELPHGIRDKGVIYVRWPVVWDEAKDRRKAPVLALTSPVKKKKQPKRARGA